MSSKRRCGRLIHAELQLTPTTAISRDFLLRLIAAVPYKIHTVRTDNGIQFTTPGAGGSAVPLIREAIANAERFRAHAFEYTCGKNGIDHRTTKAKHPWTNGQVERMNRTIKEATVRRFHYESHDQLRKHLASFLAAYNFARRLKTLKGLTPYEFICKVSVAQPQRFTCNPLHRITGIPEVVGTLGCGEVCNPLVDGREAARLPSASNASPWRKPARSG